MREISAEELNDILNKSIHKFDYVLELGVLQEPKLCVKPVYQFERAFVIDEMEFCLIYSEADDPEEIYISSNSSNLKKFKNILREYKNNKFIFHGQNGDGELFESYYYDNENIESVEYFNIRLLSPEDKQLVKSQGKDDYLNVIFKDFIKNKIWSDCGIIGAFNENNHFTGYLAYYEIAENIRDVSYIYIKKEYRRLGYAKKLLNYFANKNIEENKISYYSYTADEISEKLVKSCGFKPCAKRFER